MATRTLTGNIHDISEAAQSGFALQLKNDLAITVDGIIPAATKTIETDRNGDFAVDVVPGIKIELWLSGGFTTVNDTVRYNGNIIKKSIVVPPGESPISVQAVLAINADPDGDPGLIDIVNGVIPEPEPDEEEKPAPNPRPLTTQEKIRLGLRIRTENSNGTN